MRVNSLRIKVALSFSLLSMLLLIGQTVAVIIFADEQEDEFVEQILEKEMRSLQAQLRLNPHSELPSDDQLTAYLVRDPRDAQSLPPYLRDLPFGTSEFPVEGKELHVAVRRHGEATLYLVYDATPHERRVEDFTEFMLLGALSLGVVTALLGYWLSGLLVQQVEDLAQRVSQLDPAQEHVPLAGAYRDTEAVRLAHAFDQYHRRMAELIRREKEFTANLSHELRTPLTAIRTGCELLARDPALAGKGRERLNTVIAAAERINEALRGLLFLARETPAHETETVNLREVVEECVAPFRDAVAANPELAWEVSVPLEASLETHRGALQLVLANLVKNAVAHTRRGSIRVGYSGRTLWVSDTGSGIPQFDLPRIFERFYRGSGQSEGSGLGLAIVRQITERLGWRVGVKSEAGRGSTFTIEFPGS